MVRRPALSKRQLATFALGLTLLGGTLIYLGFTEQTRVAMSFTITVTATFWALIAFISRRILLAGFAAACLVTIINVVSQVMMRTMNMTLHAYDFFFYLNWQTLKFLWSDYPSYLVWAASALSIVGGLTVLAWCLDTTRCPRAVSGVILLATMAAAALLAVPAHAQRMPFQLFGPRHPISNFYLSWAEAFRTLWDGRMIEAAARTGLPAFATAPPCHLSGEPLNVVLIHQESLMPPSLFSTLAYDRSLDPFFRSDDGQLHHLHVETYGGGSWLTDFSILSGLSSKSFGEMRPFLSIFLRGKLKDTLPQVLAACGYRNLLFFPMDQSFLALGPFYRTVGFDTIFDQHAQGASSGRERDRVYFGKMLDTIEQQFGASAQPAFAYVQTMAAHGPYDFKYDPEESLPGGGPGTPPTMGEFLRRLAMAKIDFDFLLSELKRRFPDRRFLIVRYGDHQPSATRPYLGLPPDAELNENSAPLAYVTFYAVSGLNYAVPPLPNYDLLDPAFLGTVIMEAAGIPLPDSYRERERLMAACHGLYYSCPRRDEILTFHRRLLDSGAIVEQ